MSGNAFSERDCQVISGRKAHRSRARVTAARPTNSFKPQSAASTTTMASDPIAAYLAMDDANEQARRAFVCARATGGSRGDAPRADAPRARTIAQADAPAPTQAPFAESPLGEPFADDEADIAEADEPSKPEEMEEVREHAARP